MSLYRIAIEIATIFFLGMYVAFGISLFIYDSDEINAVARWMFLIPLAISGVIAMAFYAIFFVLNIRRPK